MVHWLTQLAKTLTPGLGAPFEFRPRMRELSSYARTLVATLALACVYGGAYYDVNRRAVCFIAALAVASAILSHRTWPGVTGRREDETEGANRALSFVAVTGDIMLVTMLIYYTGGVWSPFYVIYFLIVVFASVFYTLLQAFIITGILSFWYIVVLFLTADAENAVVLKVGLTRIPFFYLATWFSGVVGSELDRRRRREALTAQQFRTLAEIGETALSTLQIESLLAPVLERTLSLMSASAGAILLADNDGALRVVASLGLREAAPSDAYPSDGTATRAYRECRTVAADGPEPEAFLPPADSGERAIATPIHRGDRVFGVLYVSDSRPDALERDGDALLEVAANQVAMSIQNAREHQEALHANRRSSLLLRLARSISSTRELRPLFQSLVGQTADGLSASSAMLTMRREAEDELTIEAAAGDLADSPDLPDTIAAGAGIHGRCIERGTPVAVNDLTEDAVSDLLLEQLGVRSALAAPIRVEDRIIGAISTHDKRGGGGFTGEDVELLCAIADRAAVAIQNVQLHERMARSSAEITALFEAVETMSATNSIDEIMDFITHRVKSLFPCDLALVRLVNEDSGELAVAAACGPSEEAGLWEPILALPATVSTCWAIRKDKPFVVDDAKHEFRCKQMEDDSPARSYLCVPLTAGGKTLGVLQMMGAQPRAFEPAHVQLFMALADQVAIAVQRAKLHEEVQRLAVRDGLTGLFNYSYFHQQLALELTRVKRAGTPVALILMDLDHFKQFNDTYGHPTGDLLLKRLAEVLTDTVRAVDLTARMGGEEFAILLPETDKAGAQLVAEKLRAAVESAEFFGNAAAPVVHQTVSVGVASYPEDAKRQDELVRRADQALYRAKSGGRNRVVAA